MNATTSPLVAYRPQATDRKGEWRGCGPGMATELEAAVWAEHLVIGSFAEQGWAAYDQRQNGKKVATGEWGDALFRLRGGRITSKRHRYFSGILQDSLAMANGPAPTEGIEGNNQC